MERWRVALLYNLQHPATLGADATPDALAEFSTPETVRAIERALQAGGHEVIPLEADPTLLDTIRQVNPDICFNLARGIDGRYRQSHIPALLEMLNIPYTGSGVLGHTLARNKAAAKRIWRDRGLPTAAFQVFRHAQEPLTPEISTYPLFVKPLLGGAGAGIDENSIVFDEAGLRERIQWMIETYQQPALVERYLPGGEFAVGILGNLWLTEHQRTRDLYHVDGFHIFPVIEVNSVLSSDLGNLFSEATSSIKLADISLAQQRELAQLALTAFNAIGALDLARVDVRLDATGEFHLLEIDTMPGLRPDGSRFCQMAHAEEMAYIDLINEILDLALARNRLTVPQEWM